jgi:hypothetical protein
MRTAVDILEEKIYEWLNGRVYLPPAFFEYAKEMEKDQIMNAFEAAEKDCGKDFLHGDLYYNETFKSE